MNIFFGTCFTLGLRSVKKNKSASKYPRKLHVTAHCVVCTENAATERFFCTVILTSVYETKNGVVFFKHDG